jgi:hypothetical protein
MMRQDRLSPRYATRWREHWKLTGSPLARFLMMTGRPQTRLGFWFCARRAGRFIAVVPQTPQQLQLQQKPQQTIVDDEPTLGRRKKLPAQKPE